MMGVLMSNLGPYEIDNIYCGECVSMMQRLPAECIDLVVTSPPYDEVDEDLVTHPGKGLRDYQGYDWDFVKVADELWRVMKVGGVVVWVVGDATVGGSETGSSFRQALYFKRVGFKLADTMIYQRINLSYPTKNRYHHCFEYMFILNKGDKINNVNLISDRENMKAGCTVVGTVREKNGELSRKYCEGNVTSKVGIRFNVWKYGTGKNLSTLDNIAHQHPAIFPEALARDHILSWSNPNNIILDPFIGSGTTAKQAVELNRHYIGFDISQEYVDLAKRRIKGARIPLPGIN